MSNSGNKTLVGLVALLATATCLTTASGQAVTPRGPAPILFGQTEGLLNDAVTGAINAVAAHPTDSNILYVGSTNGGIWKTTNALDTNPNWINQTDFAQSQSIGDVVFDPADATSQTLVAGIGRFSSSRREGGERSGLLITTDGGLTWNASGADLVNRNISKLTVNGDQILAAINTADPFTCGEIGVFRSVDGGATFTLQTVGNSGLPNGVSTVITADPNDPDILYTSMVFAELCANSTDGIYRSADGGDSWSKVSDAPMDALITPDSGLIEIEFSQSGRVYVAISQFGRLAGLFHSSDDGVSWTAMDLPGTLEPSFVGVHAGSQASVHFSLVVDPGNENIVYVGGDRQPRPSSGFPNSIGANDFSGRLFRGDASSASGSQWAPLTHVGTANNSAPHADSRDMVFDASGNLIEGDDGGIYKRISPQSDLGDWVSLNNNLQITEGHDAAYDPLADIVITGNQDTGTSQQIQSNSTTWEALSNADGGDVAVDSISLAAFNQTIRYSSFQNLSFFNRRTFDASNNEIALVQPSLFVIAGPNVQGQFKTPVILNAIDPVRLIIGGANGVYESFDQGDTLEVIGSGIVANRFSGNVVAYGAADNEDALYVGAEDRIFSRLTMGDPLAAAGDSPTEGRFIVGVAMDINDSNRLFYNDDQQVFTTNDNGASTENITGDLDVNALGVLRSLEFATNGVFDALIVGGNRGIYVTTDNEAFSGWVRLDSNLPNVPAYELDYDSSSDTLIIGTLGRGAFSMANALASVNRRPTAVNDTANALSPGIPFVVSAISNDFDIDGSLDPTSVNIVSDVANGSTEVDPVTGDVEYTSDFGFSGGDSFTYTVADNLGRISNVATVSLDVLSDVDGDGVNDIMDNCIDVANSSQFDANGDGFGNLCDPDTDDNCIVNFLDVSSFSEAFQTSDPLNDFNNDGAVNFLDFSILTSRIFLPPGPSGIASCDL